MAGEPVEVTGGFLRGAVVSAIRQQLGHIQLTRRERPAMEEFHAAGHPSSACQLDELIRFTESNV